MKLAQFHDINYVKRDHWIDSSLDARKHSYDSPYRAKHQHFKLSSKYPKNMKKLDESILKQLIMKTNSLKTKFGFYLPFILWLISDFQ